MLNSLGTIPRGLGELPGTGDWNWDPYQHGSDNGHCMESLSEGLLSLFQLPKSRSGSELFILLSGWNALTAKLLLKIRNRDEKSVVSLSVPFFSSFKRASSFAQ